MARNLNTIWQENHMEVALSTNDDRNPFLSLSLTIFKGFTFHLFSIGIFILTTFTKRTFSGCLGKQFVQKKS